LRGSTFGAVVVGAAVVAGAVVVLGAAVVGAAVVDELDDVVAAALTVKVPVR